jgi:hypothetical protein
LRDPTIAAANLEDAIVSAKLEKLNDQVPVPL